MSTNKINIEAVNARAKEAQTPMTKIPSIEERFVANYLDGDKIQDGQMLSSRECLDAITAEREAGREEERANIPVSFLRQWINEDIKQPHQELVTNEDIMRFINIGYGK